VHIALTTPACPLRNRIKADIEQAAGGVEGITAVEVTFGTMTPEQRAQVRSSLHNNNTPIPFAQADNLTRVIAIASGKGGVGKSSITVNLAVALAQTGLSVGVLDADIYGHSVPDLLGIPFGDGPTTVEGMDMVLPVEAHGVKVMSIGMMKQDRDQPVAWRGPVIDRAISQFLTDVYWGDLDFLLIDLPPGTGDIQIGLGQKLPNAEIMVVTTPQQSATEIAERAGTMAGLMKQRVIGVIENMSYLETTCPHCGKAHRVDLFGSGGGAQVAAGLTERLGYEVPLLAELPLDQNWREGGDTGAPLVETDETNPTAAAIISIAERLRSKKRNQGGFHLKLTVNN
jgi:ATP-binding protein involved in chromosome partitioning